MKKILAAVLVILVLVVAGVIILAFSLGSVIKTGVETLGPRVTQTSVTLADVTFSPLSGNVDIRGVTIGNPQGFKTQSAFELDRVRAVVVPASLLSDRIVIREIFIDGPQITYEASLSGSNIGKIKENVAAFAGGASDESAPSGPDGRAAEEGPGKKVEIDDFRIRNANINLSATILGGKSLSVPLPEVHLTGIGKQSGGKSAGGVASEIFSAVADRIIGAATGAGGLLKDSAGTAAETVKEGAAVIVDGVKGIFKK